MISRPTQFLYAVAVIQRTISITGDDGRTQGVTAAYPFMQRDTSGVNLPFWVNKLGGGDSAMSAQGRRTIEDTVEMYLCLRPEGSMESQAALLEYAADWRDAVYAAFDLKRKLGNTLDFILVTDITHWDLVKIELGTAKFYGLKFDLSVRENFTAVIGL